MVTENQKHSVMRKVLLFVGVAVGLIIITTQAKAQTNMFMYGEVITIDGDRYQGFLRWGTDEVYWHDMYNASKTSNDFNRFLSRSEKAEIEQRSSGNGWSGIAAGVLSIWEDKYSGSNHQFDTRFGDISSIEFRRGSRALIKLKNGVVLEVGGTTYSDINPDIRLMDDELGEVTLKSSRIEQVNFLPSPNSGKAFGTPIYGTVNAGRKGTFSGIIQWDNDERFKEDILDGKDRDGDKKIPFESIKRIEKMRSGVEVTLHSDRKFYLTGSNDVNSENRGIVMLIPDVGQVKIPWREFNDLEITEGNFEGFAYSDFPVSEGLSGTVVTVDGDEYTGLLAYDLDEAWEFEILDGNDDDVEYHIPLRNVKNIIPKNYSYSSVILKNGMNLLLGGSRDVDEDNDGVLVFTSKNDDPVYVRWSKIDEIIFD